MDCNTQTASITFNLGDVPWPVLLLKLTGEVYQCNKAAEAELGIVSATESSNVIAEHWSLDNKVTYLEFLSRTRQIVPTVIKLNIPGITKSFSAMLSPLAKSEAQYVLQLQPFEKNDNLYLKEKSLKQKLDCIVQLTRSVALDFNNALTGILAHNSLLLSKISPDSPLRHSLVEVEKSASRAAEIARDLAVFSRQEKQARPAPLGDVNMLSNKCIAFFKATHASKFTWRITLSRPIFAVRYDEAKIQQALSKVIENAIDCLGSSTNGSISVQTRNLQLATATQDRNVQLIPGNYVCFEVSDNGPGIPEEQQARLFEPFFTTKRAPHRGLGLPLVYGIITNHGGGVAISSQLGQGTSVRIYLPAENELLYEEKEATSSLRGTGTVLVVDDEELLLTMSETILSEFGYKVITANNGIKALQVLEKSGDSIDLVITDMVMPEMSGRELIDAIRKQDPTLPIICTSGYFLPEDKPDNPGLYLQKPFTSSMLLGKVQLAVAEVPRDTKEF